MKSLGDKDRGNGVSGYKIFTSFPNYLVVILLVSNIVLFGFITYKQGYSHKENAANARKNDAKIEEEDKRIERLDSLYHKYRGKKWYCIGDNLTSNHLYQGRVRDICKFNIVITDGQPGVGMARMSDHLTVQNLADVDLVTVFAGMYDFGGSTELGEISDDKTKDTFYGSLERMIERVTTLNSCAKIVFITPLKIGKSQYGIIYPSSNSAGYSLEQYVRAIEDVCNKHQIQVINLFNQNGLDYNSLVSQYSTAYDKLAKVIADELEQ